MQGLFRTLLLKQSLDFTDQIGNFRRLHFGTVGFGCWVGWGEPIT